MNFQINHIFQLFLDFSIFLIEFLTVMNAYNGTKLDNLLIYCIPTIITFLHLVLYKKSCFRFVLPSLFIYCLGVIAQGSWYSEYWQVNTRHRTEFYDTHAIFTSFMFYVIVRSIDLIFIQKKPTSTNNII